LARVTASSISPQCSTGFPSVATTWSRGRSPACAAGESGSTRPIVGSRTGTPTAANTAEKIIAAKTKFMPGPAKTISARAQRGFVEKDLAGSIGGAAVGGWIASSPIIFTYPPSGTIETQYSVSPRRNEKIRGPKPSEKRSTPTPIPFATRKCPSSWMKISAPSATIALTT
jgi:hypothetical protein